MYVFLFIHVSERTNGTRDFAAVCQCCIFVWYEHAKNAAPFADLLFRTRLLLTTDLCVQASQMTTFILQLLSKKWD